MTEPKPGLEATALFIRDMDEGHDKISDTVAKQRIIKAAAFGELVAKLYLSIESQPCADGTVYITWQTLADFHQAVSEKYRSIYGEDDNG